MQMQNEEQDREFNEAGTLPLFLTAAELARRWNTSPRTLARWRASGIGPAWIVLGGSVRYRWSDVLDHEDRMRVAPGREP